MNITVQIELSKSKAESFSELEQYCYQAGLQMAKELMKRTLEELDSELMQKRDHSRYRSKGLSATCIRTLMGDVAYRRHVYVDRACVEGTHCVYLLDSTLGMRKIGLVSENVCKIIAGTVCESTYRATAEQLGNLTGLQISHQAIWNVTQKLGKQQTARLDRYSELAQLGAGPGEIVTKLLYMESDGIWLKLQGPSRTEYGVSKEMKIGIAYDGVLWTPTGNGGKRRTLDNKIALAGFMKAKEFRSKREGLVASRFNVSQIEMRILNGDGAQWIRKQNGVECLCVLDKFHRNKKITECVADPQFAETVRTLLYEKRIDDLLECIAAQKNSVDDEQEKGRLGELLSYYTENKESLLSCYDRNVNIPETRLPGEVHHARLGSMESNVYTLIGNRMKDGRACWSINGANNLAALLCAYHTSGFEYLFEDLPALPEPEPDWVDDGQAISASKMPFKDGKGYEYCGNVSTTNSVPLLRSISNFSSITNLSIHC